MTAIVNSDALKGSSTFDFLAGFSVALFELDASGRGRLPRFFYRSDGQYISIGVQKMYMKTREAGTYKPLIKIAFPVAQKRRTVGQREDVPRGRVTNLARVSSCFFFSSSS